MPKETKPKPHTPPTPQTAPAEPAKDAPTGAQTQTDTPVITDYASL